MTKIFKASLLASAVAISMSAQAATVSSTPTQLSTEGLSVGLTSTAAFSFDVVVTQEHASSSEIVLTFSDKVDLTGVLGGACNNTIANGTGDCGDILFDYGTGSFTFDTVAIDDTARTVTFNVNLGNPLTANSAFRVTVGDANLPDLSGASTVGYASNLAGTAIETGTGIIAQEVTQYSASVASEFDGIIERTARQAFTSGNVAMNDQADTIVLAFGDQAASVVNRAFADGTTVVINGDFSDTSTHVAAAWAAAGAAAPAVVDNVNDTVTFTYTEAEWDAVIGGTGEDTITFDKQVAGDTIDPTSFTVDVDHDFTSLTAGAGTAGTTAELANSVDGGEWALDAAVINVPYLPVGFGLSPNIEVANEDGDSEIILEGFDNNGNTYGPVTLPFMANKDTVTKVSEANIQAAFGLATDMGYKLSVTFIFDADADKVTLAPYYRQNESRVNVMSDQYKADDIR